MKKVISNENKPIKMWLPYLEDGAEKQARNLANLPFLVKHVAIMPDSHQGYGMPIGGVVGLDGVIIPNAVGVDIGCGMCAVKTSLKYITTDDLKMLDTMIRATIPLGFNKHKKVQSEMLMPALNRGAHPIVEDNYGNARISLGTLGGGNHFIELQKGDDGFIYIMIHSGSRNLGKQVAEYYNEVAKEMNKVMHSSVPPSHDLAFLPLDSKAGQDYLNEMNYCVEYALANRKHMMEAIKDILYHLFKFEHPNLEMGEMINIAHNYASVEHHFGRDVVVHRKGATSAREHEVGIIPGSQGTSSYIVEGLGNPESFNSCSHGAGRLMSRSKAKANLNLEEEMKKMEGVINGMKSVKQLDEAPGSYKDIDEVMANQEDLVKVLVKLTPILSIKG